MADYSYYTRRIRDIREDNDLTQQQIAEILGTSQTMYARYERGANELPIPIKGSMKKIPTNTDTTTSNIFLIRTILIPSSYHKQH